MNQNELIKKLTRNNLLANRELLEAFLKIDRADFVTPESLGFTYQDSALPLFNGQTISQPATVAFMLEKLELGLNLKVLEIGFGSGWQTAIISKMIGPKGLIDAFEIDEKIFDFGVNNLKKYNLKNTNLINQSAVEYLKTNNKKYDRIISGAAFSGNLGLIRDSLKVGGVAVIPLKNNSVHKVIRKNDDFIKENYYGFVFVPIR